MMYPLPQIPQGWECPKCRRVYSPNTPMCYTCGNGSITTSGLSYMGLNPVLNTNTPPIKKSYEALK